MTQGSDWNDRYRDGNLPWDTGRPSSELQRMLSQHAISPCRALDIGCGSRKIEADAVGIDRSAESAADVIWDLDSYPWPLPDDNFDRIHMSHVIEHLADPVRAMTEVHRVARPGGVLSTVSSRGEVVPVRFTPSRRERLNFGPV